MAGPRMSLYYSSKVFARNFSECIAEEEKGTGVTVTALLLGPTSTGFEKADEMKNSKIFTFIKPATASQVAEAGFKACQKGKVLCYCRFITKLMSVGERILPRRCTRQIAKRVNG